MNRFSKTLLLLGLQAQCKADHKTDWQSLHRRDRQWFLSQTESSPWETAYRWLQAFANWGSIGFTPSVLLVILVGALFGVGLMSGLLQFQPQQRINLWWWLLLCVWLPTLWWLFGLWLGRSMNRNSLAGSLSARFLPQQLSAFESPLLGMTSRALAQQFSLGFALGLLGTFIAYLVLTDLAFGWSSTLDLSDQGVQAFTQALSLPWQGLWPAAVPSLELVEHTRFFRIDVPIDDPAAIHGDGAFQWWPFLMMNLLVYVLLPRLLSFVWAQWQLARAQQRLFTQDACIDGWWQRLHQELVRQQASPAPRNRKPDPLKTAVDTDNHAWPELQAIVTSGHWSADQLATQIAKLPNAANRLPLFTERQALDATLLGRVLLLCKGWEPPTSALADLCQQLHAQKIQTFLLPAPLPGMKPQRIAQLYESWRLFMPQLPPGCHLLELHQDV